MNETVVFLVSDLEGSTDLLASVGPDEYGRLLSDYRELVEEPAALEGGQVVDREGDGIVIAFPTAAGALRAAGEAQRALSDHPWPHAAQVRARMSIHAGEVRPHPDGYVGLALHQAARVAEAAWGGQVLVSEAAGAMAGGDLPDETELRNLGEYRLRNLEGPQRLFQLTAPGLQTSFPPLRTRAWGRTRNFPTPQDPLVGRDREMAEIHEMLDAPSLRLITLVGPAGVGKTRLAIEVALRRIPRHPDGCCYVPLTPAGSPEELVPALLQALDFTVDTRTGLDPRTQLLDYLEARSVLLLLDNFEHLMGGVELVGAILERAPETQLLITSRERLGVGGEQVYRVEGLPYPGRDHLGDPGSFGAVELFSERARRTDASFEALPAEREQIARICRLVDGLPLGVELAAGWIRVLSPREIAEELERGIDLLSTAMRDVPARHRSLRAALDGSWNLLDEPLRRVLSTLAVFRGGFSREAAREVSGTRLEDLSALIDKSLLRRTGSERYDLHPLVTQYALERLGETPSDLEAARDRHARYYASFLTDRKPDLERGLQAEARDEIRSELDNIRAALEWAAGHWDRGAVEPISAFGAFYNVQDWYEGARELRRLAEHAHRERGDDYHDAFLAARAWEANFAASLSRTDRTEQICRAVLPALRERKLRAELAVCLYAKGLDPVLRGERGAAIPDLEESVELARRVDEPVQLGLSLLLLGWAHFRLGRLEAAQACFDESLETFDELENPWGRAFALTKLGLSADAAGDHQRAARYHREACEIFAKLGDRSGEAIASSRLSWTSWFLGDHRAAREHARESLELFEEIGHRWGMGVSRCRLAFADLQAGNVDSAHQAFLEALQIGLRMELAIVTIYGVIGLGNVFAAQGRHEEAARVLSFAESYPGTPSPYRCYIDPVLEELREHLSPDRFAAAEEEAASTDLETLAARLLETAPAKVGA